MAKEFKVLYVGLDAPLDIIEEREKKRGDRMVGGAKGMYHKIHKDVVYDLVLDTHKNSLSENVKTTLSYLTSYGFYIIS